jgi:hydrogenase maturation protein HypF
MQGKAIHITGIVQGVGFRPFVYNLALRHDLGGWVRNTSEGVDIQVEGTHEQLDAFIAALSAEAPPLSHIDTFTVTDCPPEGFTVFEIRNSHRIEGAFQPISPDVALCADCQRELLTPTDQRYRYPFINCTNCGPRFTIIKDIPYDRPQTTMAEFELCPVCAAEYHDPANRRFHAQPVACAECGPQVWLEYDSQRFDKDDAIQQAISLLRAGKILALRGLGGFHLACDATNAAAVAELRRRKQRPDKPFAVMMRDMAQIERYCVVSAEEATLLTAPAAPIVLLHQTTGQSLANEVAPKQVTLGVMLPYTPLHRLLFDADMPPLVMTSGNRSGEPIVTTNDAAQEKLADIADAFLFHNRDIYIRTDDSVVRVWNGVTLPMRRSRGYVPFPVTLPYAMPSVLAVGGEMKNTFCLTRENRALLSHHIGTLDNYATVQSLEQGITHFETMFRVTPTLIVHDLHPDYASTRYAVDRAEHDTLPRIAVQHHHAHIAACMAEHQLSGERPVIGVCFDGTGYGTDGTIWGGEFLLADYHGFERLAHLKPMPLPGGDASTRKPARIALAALMTSGLTLAEDLPPAGSLSAEETRIVQQQIERGINTPLTSSVGRLFDAVSALLGVCQVATYEGQAAIELEAVADAHEDGVYPIDDTAAGLDPAPLITQLVNDWREGVSANIIAARFHNSIAAMIVNTVQRLVAETGIREVALTGGVFQNVTLLNKTVPALETANLTVYTHRLVPPNDGGLALGQAIIGHTQYHTTPTITEAESRPL